MANWDGIIDPHSSVTVCDPAPVLYRADGTPLKRQIGFAMQSSGTFPALSDGHKKTMAGSKAMPSKPMKPMPMHKPSMPMKKSGKK